MFVPITGNHWRLNRLSKDSEEYQKNGIIQEGEATGHHHKLENLNSAEVYRFGNSGNAIVVVGREGARIIHDEHGPIFLEPNTSYEVHIAQEEDPTGEIRRVMD